MAVEDLEGVLVEVNDVHPLAQPLAHERQVRPERSRILQALDEREHLRSRVAAQVRVVLPHPRTLGLEVRTQPLLGALVVPLELLQVLLRRLSDEPKPPLEGLAVPLIPEVMQDRNALPLRVSVPLSIVGQGIFAVLDDGDDVSRSHVFPRKG